MKVVLDNCIPKGLKALLVEHFEEVSECRDMGWAELENGKLLAAAQSSFDVFITVDTGIPYQQNLAKFSLGFVIIRAKRNKIDHLLPMIDTNIKAALEVKVGQAIHVV